ncbi:bifunctional [glutamine synthetase] adenylyltransferase/[glutamine synthetase]-adenylyl-L-tyrosine phosphorylase [Nesterenkonia sp.]|uniref:bifunctional [glutamine synthetase] adenylyltransferase/[glutamine synthetase]-adenylyl-L-tyrosine phosphorylase n=1 Tax=Nesterenkonia sp. TaxID=704201 RepID=UPI002627B05D|nr:bifunctional [glutamine synthetase] adenylyltransferase/[glutamine synthetase]-adenylyl-L-tyrosine phosphorylase [Nesterenkonia sp.]
MTTITSRDLISAGFQQLERAESFLADHQLADLDPAALVRTLREAPNPDEALLLLIRLTERAPSVFDLFSSVSDGIYTEAVPAVRLLGASQALGEFLIRHPEQTDLLSHAYPPDPEESSAEELRTRLMEAVRADPQAEQPVAALDEELSARAAGRNLRIAYRREVTRLALRDLCAADPADYVPAAARQLADAASAAIDAALAVTRAEAAARAPQTEQVELTVIGMGKTGARELNYISDVDVLFVHRAPDELGEAEARTAAETLASGISRVLGASDGEPALWEIDANLRPEGRDGPLSRTLESHQEYYRRWASGWEFQALLKARPIAGSRGLGQAYMEAIWPLVWQSSSGEGFVEDVQAMRRRVYQNIPPREAERELKLGRGGLRDIEFTVQLLQLVHGRVDEDLHVRDTLSAIAALGVGEYVSSRDQEAMSRCYRQLRLLEHRIQMRQMRRTHLMPQKEEHLRALAQAVRPPGETKRHSPDDVLEVWRQTVREVSTFHQTIFYRPLLSTTAVLGDDDVRLSADAVQARLGALGYRDTSGALRHIEALTSGVTRKATLQRRILPAMLGWLADGVDPDHGLLAFRRISESLGTSPWYLTMLRDSSMAAERLCQMLTSSRLISEMLEHMPESTQWLGDDAQLAPRSFEAQWTEVQNAIARHEGETGSAVRLARLIRQRELLRIAVAEACQLIDVEQAGAALAEVDRVATLGALRVAENEIRDDGELLVEFLVVAMGRQGGREISYGSDMDAMFVHRPLPGTDKAAADAQAQKVALRLTQLLSKPTKPPVRGELPLQLDADLRPEGTQGPLSRSLDSFAEYYQRWMAVWERQALLRARPIAGSADLAQDFTELIDSVRYGQPPEPAQIREIRRIKARVESERLPRGADPARHVKLGRGGLADVEWLVQLYQLQHAHHLPVLRGTGTLQVLNALVDQQLMGPEDAYVLAQAWQLCTRVRSGIMIWNRRSSDVLPSSRRDLEAVSRWCGFEAGSASTFEEHYLRTTRRARQVFERLFFDA